MIAISHAKFQINVSVFVSGWNWYSGIKDGPLPSPVVLWIVSISEENPDRKKNIAVTRTIAVPAGSRAGTQPQKKQALTAATQVAFKDCASFKDCRTEINDTCVDYAYFINIAMSMYNLIEYSENYSDSSGSLWGLKRDEIANNANVTNDDNVI